MTARVDLTLIDPDAKPRPSGKNALRVSCGCRSIRVFPSALTLGDIRCEACGSVFG